MSRRVYGGLLAILIGVCFLMPACSSGEKANSVDLSQIHAPDLDGKEVSLEQFKGRVLMVNFWATWCPPCKEEVPDLIAIQKEYEEKGLTIVGISVDKAPVDKVRQFVREHQINFEVLYPGERTEEVADQMGGIRGIPTTFLVDRQGRVAKKIVGAIPVDQWRTELDKLI